jgi:monoamine oxidase
MGKVIRLTLRFRDRFWDDIFPACDNSSNRSSSGHTSSEQSSSGQSKTLSGMSFLFSQDDFFPTWWTRMPEALPIITGWAPFRCAERLSGANRSLVISQALETLGRLLRSDSKHLAQTLEAAYFHDWQDDPFSRGAYSYGPVGADELQTALASPLDNALFFAGEATDTTGHNGTVHGAIATGRRAAREIVRSLH